MQMTVQCTTGDPWCPIHGWGYCGCNLCPTYPVYPSPIGVPPAPLQWWIPPLPTLPLEEIASRQRMLALASAMAALLEAGVKVEDIEIVIGHESTIVRKRITVPSSVEESK